MFSLCVWKYCAEQYWNGTLPVGYVFVMFVPAAGFRICCWPMWQIVVGSGNAVVLVTVAFTSSSAKIWFASPVLQGRNSSGVA
jgi:hypothetical protein